MINSGRSPLKASELLAAQLRADIASGKLAAGTTLPTEAKMMIEFGVGRPTLREALRLLESEALVRVRRGVRGGVEVLTPTTRPAAHCFSLLLSHAGSTLHEVLALRVEL